MRSSVSSSRTVAAFVTQPTSRIPHLCVHIVQRRIRPSLVSQADSFTTRSRRFHNTFAQAGLFQPNNITVEEGAHADEVDVVATSRDVGDTIWRRQNTEHEDTLHNLPDKEANLYTILERGQPDQVYLALRDDTIGVPFIRYAPDDLFEKAFLLLEPERFVEPMKTSHRHLWKHANAISPRDHLQIFEEHSASYTAFLERLLRLRRESGTRVSLNICRHALKWAGSLGNQELAANIMDIIMFHDRVKPDVLCYNYFLEATNWSNAFSQAERFKLRVIPHNLSIRASYHPPIGLSGHRVANPVKNISGIRSDVLKVYKRLIEKDVTADEFTFTNLMIAMGREGDIAGVKSILKSVWNIDIDLLLKYDEDEIESPTFYEADSHLRPSDRLLFAVAHIFGSNNDAQTAWVLVDYISRNYDLPVSRQVWQHLLEWYLVLSLNRSESQRKQGQAIGRISHDIFEQLYSIMTDEPHNIMPDSVMLYLLSRGRRNSALDERLAVTQDLRHSFRELFASLNVWTERMETVLQGFQKTTEPDFWNNTSFFDTRHKFLQAALDWEVCLYLLGSAVRKNLLEAPGHIDGASIEWERRVLPDLIQEYHEHLPDVLRFRTAGGDVELECKVHRDHLRFLRYGTQYQNMCKIVDGLSWTKDPTSLFANAKWLAENLHCSMCNSRWHLAVDCPHERPQESTTASPDGSLKTRFKRLDLS